MKLLSVYFENGEQGKAHKVEDYWRQKLSVLVSQEANKNLATLEHIIEE